MPVLIPPPTKFVGLHCHSGFSVYDGLGYPADHIDFVLENGMNAWALTDHGNGSGLAHAHKHAEKLKKIVFENQEKIPAYGASARSSTLLNYCGITSEQISKVIDKNPLKSGLITAGSNIPIVSFEEGIKNIKNESKILLLAWNFQDEIVRELSQSDFNGEFIVPLPGDPHILWSLHLKK